MKEYRAVFTEKDGRGHVREFGTMDQAQEFYDSRTETAIQKLNQETGTREDVLYPVYEI